LEKHLKIKIKLGKTFENKNKTWKIFEKKIKLGKYLKKI